MTVSNKLRGRDVKNIFFEKENLNPNEYKVRLLYKGHEIKDDHILDVYNFDIHPQIQVSLSKLEKTDIINENDNKEQNNNNEVEPNNNI